MCANFHCIWRSCFEVRCTLVSALKSNMAAISTETNRGKFYFIYFFSIFFHTDHNKCTMKWLGWKMSKIVFRPALSHFLVKAPWKASTEHIHRLYFCSFTVPSENKRDSRTIEQVMAESKARKKLKTNHDPQSGVSRSAIPQSGVSEQQPDSTAKCLETS